jgi:hypothetical protein
MAKIMEGETAQFIAQTDRYLPHEFEILNTT